MHVWQMKDDLDSIYHSYTAASPPTHQQGSDRSHLVQPYLGEVTKLLILDVELRFPSCLRINSLRVLIVCTLTKGAGSSWLGEVTVGVYTSLYKYKQARRGRGTERSPEVGLYQPRGGGRQAKVGPGSRGVDLVV